jgi:aquaporin Z
VLFGIGFSMVAVLVSPRSPIEDAVKPIRFLLIGLTFGVLSALIAVSPLGRRSGAHLNPAVTLAFWLRGDVHRHDLAGYLVAQFLGALVGTALFGAVLGSWATSIRHARTSPSVGLAAGLVIEAALTLGLLVAIFGSLSIRWLTRWTPAVAAVVLTGLIWIGSPRTGASLNPARSLAPALLEHDPSALWIYFAGPTLGATVAVWIWQLVGPTPLTAKLFHDRRYRSTMRCALPAGVSESAVSR